MKYQSCVCNVYEMVNDLHSAITSHTGHTEIAILKHKVSFTLTSTTLC